MDAPGGRKFTTMPGPCDETLDRLLAEFRDQMDQFVFFHLGSDAQVRVDSGRDGIRVFVEHNRVHPFQFQATRDKIERLLKSEEFEDFMLELLVRHRRHA
jgi:hypothetical protein